MANRMAGQVDHEKCYNKCLRDVAFHSGHAIFSRLALATYYCRIKSNPWLSIKP